MNQHLPWRPQPPRRQRTFRQWFRAQTRFTKWGLGCGSLILLLLLCMGSLAVYGSTLPQPEVAPTQTISVANNTTSQPATLPPIPTVSSTLSPSPTPTPTAIPTASPTPSPRPTPTPTAIPSPTPTKTPPPTPTACPGINCNPWGYNFNPGNLIYYPPSNFCAYFNCIPSFWEPDDPGDGYVVQCVDGSYSQSGGESGACSYHGGVSRPLYSH